MTARRMNARACSRSKGAGRRNFYGCADVKPDEPFKIEVRQ